MGGMLGIVGYHGRHAGHSREVSRVYATLCTPGYTYPVYTTLYHPGYTTLPWPSTPCPVQQRPVSGKRALGSV